MGLRVQPNATYEWSEEAIRLGISHREVEVLALVASGFKYKEVAEILHIKHQSVNNHMHSLGKKLGTKNIAQAWVVATHLNLVRVENRLGDRTFSYKEADMMKVFRRIIEGGVEAQNVKEKDRRALMVFLLAHGIDLDGTMNRLESEGGSSGEKRE